MIKILYVPGWLKQHMIQMAMPNEALLVDKLSAAIISRSDLINYYCELQAFRQLLITDDGIALPERCYYHSLPMDLPEFTVRQKSIRAEMLTDDPAQFTYEADANGNVIFVIGKPTSTLATRTVDDTFLSSIMWNVLNCAHNSLRVLDGKVDKCSVFRENPELTQFYVASLF